MTNIPIELFGMFLAMSAIMFIAGIASKKAVIIMIGGTFMIITAVLTDYIIMGQQVSTSTTAGTTTTYTYQTVLFQFTQYHKLTMGLIGGFIMLVSVLYARF